MTPGSQVNPADIQKMIPESEPNIEDIKKRYGAGGN
jgi:hypothetical protein